MSKIKEITKDNCVLDSQELGILNVAFKDYENACLGHHKNWGKMKAAEILQKIEKLNDLAKEQDK